MNHIFAKIRTRSSKKHFKLVSNKKLFDTLNINLDYCIPYSPDHNLDEDSWFKLEEFSKKAYCLNFMKEDFSSLDYDDLPKENFKEIAYIFSNQSNDFYFQKITPSLFLKKKFIAMGDIAKIEESKNRIIINQEPDAVYFKGKDTLVFKNLSTIASIFIGIDQEYKEATQGEVKDFLLNDFISLKDNYNENKVSTPNRKRISLAIKILNSFSKEEKKEILLYINEYNSDDKLKFDKNISAFEISDDNQLKLLLYGIQQRYYTTKVGKEKRLANSVVII